MGLFACLCLPVPCSGFKARRTRNSFSVGSCECPTRRRRRAANLNKAYAFLSEPTFGAAARALTDRLVDMGFEESEAQDNIEQVRLPLDGSENLVDPHDEPAPIFTFAFTPTPEALYALREATDDRWKLKDCGAEGGVEIEITGWVNQGSEQAINALLPEQERAGFCFSCCQASGRGQGPVVAR